MKAQRTIYSRVVALVLLAASFLVLNGCASNSGQPQIGPIAFTDANGQQLGGTFTTLPVGGTAYVDVALVNDPNLLGADWSVNCGSAPPPGTPLPPGATQDESCGYFTPVHTASGPVPQYATSGTGIVTLYTAPAVVPKSGTVTLYAAATANHSKYSSVTLVITGLGISIGLVSPYPPATLTASASAPLKAIVANDSAAGGVNWTVACGSSDCGSFNPAQTASGIETTYTAPSTVPAGGSVTLKATSVTDPTKSVSATITIQQ